MVKGVTKDPMDGQVEGVQGEAWGVLGAQDSVSGELGCTGLPARG